MFLFDLAAHAVIIVSSPCIELLIPTTHAPFPPFTGNCVMNPIPALGCIISPPCGEFITHTQMKTPVFLAAAAALTAPGLLSIELSCNPFGPSFIKSFPLSGFHPTTGLDLQLDILHGHLPLLVYPPGIPAVCVSKWCSSLQFPGIIAVNTIQMMTCTAIQQSIATLCSTKPTTCDVCHTFDEIRNNLLHLVYHNTILIKSEADSTSMPQNINPTRSIH